MFAFYQLLRHKPKVIICLRSLKEWTQGGPDYRVREEETACAMRVAGCEWEQWPHLDTEWDLDPVRSSIAGIIDDYDIVIGPAYEEGGHEQHNDIARFLEELIPDEAEHISYLTYKRGHGRSESPNEVIPTADERILKDVALACYQSQKDFPPTAPWFGDDQREFLA